ncbi:MAG: hypothetical protein ACI9JU_003044 [Pseudohongiellaceae bacterium]|jgi:hypothetical protein
MGNKWGQSKYTVLYIYSDPIYSCIFTLTPFTLIAPSFRK